MSEYLISIGVPTYNRAHVLKQMLENITSLPSFVQTNDVEVVISDNASTDDTPLVVKAFVEKYPERIRYFRNDMGVGSENFHLALERGRGCFRKLANDTLLFTEEGLSNMIAVVRQFKKDRPLLYFRSVSPRQASDVIRCSSFENFFKLVGFYTTWIAETGFWDSDLSLLADFGRFNGTCLPQMDAILRLVSARKDIVVVRRNFFRLVPYVKQSRINVAEIFGVNYFAIIHTYVLSGELTKTTYEKEKWRVFRGLILPAYLATKNVSFTKQGYFKFLWREYRFKWYLYAFFPLVVFAMLVAPVRKKLKV